jgi:hypothetical protein
MLLLVRLEIIGELGRIVWIGVEPLPANRAGIFTAPGAFAFPVDHHRPKADFFCGHTEKRTPI